MTVPGDNFESPLICDRDVVKADAYNLAIFSMCRVDCCKLLAPSGTESNPDIAKLSNQRSWNPRQVAVSGEVREDVVDDQPG